MLAKPSACEGCPLYQDGQGFVPDDLVEGSEVFVLGQNPGRNEEEQGRPFVGETGKMFNEVYLPLAGLSRDRVSVGNAFRCRVIKNGRRVNDLPPPKILAEAVEHCTREHLQIPPTTKLIVTQGAVALHVFDESKSVTEWRGFLLPPQGEEYG